MRRFLNVFLIEKRAVDLLDRIKDIRRDSININKLTLGKGWIEVVRIFMMLLFLAQSSEIDLHQDEDETEIIITLKELENNE